MPLSCHKEQPSEANEVKSEDAFDGCHTPCLSNSSQLDNVTIGHFVVDDGVLTDDIYSVVEVSQRMSQGF